MSGDRIIVGLDFGTTFTGVAFVWSATPEDIEPIKSWPGYVNQAGELSSAANLTPKVPTESLPRKCPPRYLTFIRRSEDTRIQCIKLFIDPDQPLPSFMSRQDVDHELHRAGKNVARCVEDFLAGIYKYTMATLNKRFSEEFVRLTKIQFIVTIPAVWSDKAKNATRTAAVRAGISPNSLRMISQPEAAACYTLKVIQPNHLEVGHTLVVCDAGGGTVDLITYKITNLKPLTVQEFGIGSGGMCGAAFTNYRFEDHVRERLGDDRCQELINDKPKSWLTGLKYWEEHVKRNFNPEDEEEFNVPFPGLADDEEAGLESGYMLLASDQVHDIFEPVILSVLHMIEVQVDAVESKRQSVHAILLVGGFGQSQYLYERVNEHFNFNRPSNYTPTSVNGAQQAKPIVVMQPPNAWTAVARGAVLRGLEGGIVSDRRSRYNYGIKTCSKFKFDKHPSHSMFWDNLREEWTAKGCMLWYVKKGELVNETRDISLHFTRTVRGEQFPNGNALFTNIPLYSDTKDEAATMYEPREMKLVCTLLTDLTPVPRLYFAKRSTSTGLPYWSLDYVVEMRIDSAQLHFMLKVGGVTYGSVQAEFA